MSWCRGSRAPVHRFEHFLRDAGTGAPLLAAASTAPGQGITLEFSDGRVAAHVDSGDAGSDPSAKKRGRGPGNQGSLF